MKRQAALQAGKSSVHNSNTNNHYNMGMLAGNTTVTEITVNSTRACSSGAAGMASLSAVTVVAIAVAAAFAL